MGSVVTTTATVGVDVGMTTVVGVEVGSGVDSASSEEVTTVVDLGSTGTVGTAVGVGRGATVGGGVAAGVGLGPTGRVGTAVGLAYSRPAGWQRGLGGFRPRACPQPRVWRPAPRGRPIPPRLQPAARGQQPTLPWWQVSVVSTRTFPHSRPFRNPHSIDPVTKRLGLPHRFGPWRWRSAWCVVARRRIRIYLARST